MAELQHGRFNRGGRYLRKLVALWCFTSVLGVLVDKALLKKLFIASQLHVVFLLAVNNFRWKRLTFSMKLKSLSPVLKCRFLNNVDRYLRD